MFDRKKTIIFDLDGTLIDSVGVWNAVDVELVKQIGGGERDGGDLQRQRDTLLRERAASSDPYGDYCAYLKEKYASPLTVDEIHSRRYRIARDFLENVVDYKPRADEFIKALKARGFSLAIATATRRGTVDIYRTVNHNMLAKAPLDEYFSPVYAREDVRAMKPDPEVYFRILGDLGAAPAECLIFEDSLIGVESARNAGIESVAVYDRYSDGDRARIDALADYRVRDYGAAIEILKRETVE
ncbi:MAG: HAD family phosphatase [Pyramidobacter sp.]|uniref:HAD family hydrolase n=1 Tax=Pyramidobacter sp. TaxID=1943581 RepID=UPI002A803CAE|nr:HAD family phosphatase [Pyramidobacter sp.]MDY4031695.1 HAD family phosphatase [Pyramidobacter sp.]